MSLTGNPLLILFTALAVLIPLLVVTIWSRRGGGLRAALRFLAIVVAQVMAVATVGLWANNTFGFYNSWSDLLGHSSVGPVSVAASGPGPTDE